VRLRGDGAGIELECRTCESLLSPLWPPLGVPWMRTVLLPGPRWAPVMLCHLVLGLP